MTARSFTVSLSILALFVLVPSAAASGRATPAAVKITASAAPSAILGSQIGIKGKVHPYPAGLRLTLQRHQGKAWFAVGTKRANSAGAFSFSVRPTSVGLATYRVVTSKGASYLGASGSVAVNVLTWTYLAEIYDAPSVGDLYADPVTLNGVRYGHPVSLDAGCYNHWGGDAWVNYKLGRRAVTFTADVTFGGLANAGSKGSYTIYADGKIVSSGDLTYGAATKVSLSLAGVKSLRLLGNVPNTAGDGSCSLAFTEVVFGDARILSS